MRDEIEEQGGLKLIFIDAPFYVGADFSMANGYIPTHEGKVVQSALNTAARREETPFSNTCT